jgi:hypothetical protein
MTVEAIVNPDFSQIESDAGQVDINTTFALSSPEQRPFFQEGYDLFLAAINAVYTRSINDPEFAIKAIKRGSRTSIGYLMARDRNSPYILPGRERSSIVAAGKSTSNILRIKHSVGNGSRIGLIVTDQRFDNGGKTYSLAQDALFRLTPTFTAHYHLAATHTNEFNSSAMTNEISDPDKKINDIYTRAFDGESFWGHFILGHLQWKTSTWFSEFEYQEAAPTYRQPNGFVRQSGFSAYWIILGRDIRIASSTLETIRPSIEYESEWNYHSRPRYRYVKTNLLTRLRFAQASFNLTYVNSSENFSGSQFDDIWYLYQKASLQLNDHISSSWSVTYGHQIARRYVTLGNNLDLEFQATIKLSERFLIKQDFDYAKSESIVNGELLYDGYISRTRLNSQISSPLSARLIVEYNGFYDLLSVDPLLTYRVNAFSVLYIGMTSSYQSLTEFDTDGSFMESNRLISRQFFAKLQYLFQL